MGCPFWFRRWLRKRSSLFDFQPCEKFKTSRLRSPEEEAKNGGFACRHADFLACCPEPREPNLQSCTVGRLCCTGGSQASDFSRNSNCWIKFLCFSLQDHIFQLIRSARDPNRSSSWNDEEFTSPALPRSQESSQRSRGLSQSQASQIL